MKLEGETVEDADTEQSYGFRISREGSKFLARHNYRIVCNGDQYDVLELAKECREAWDEFMKQHNIVIPKESFF